MNNIKSAFADPRRRTIIITVIAAFILLVLSVILVVNLTNKVSTSEQVAKEAPATAIEMPFGDSESKDKDIATAAESTLEPVKNSTETETETAAPVVTETVTGTTSSLPKTGPEDTIALILILGATTSYLTSRRLARRA